MIMFGANALLFIWAIFNTFVEIYRIRDACRMLYMCDQVFDVDGILDECCSSVCDLSVLVNLVHNNLERTNPAVKMCTAAWRIGEVTAETMDLDMRRMVQSKKVY